MVFVPRAQSPTGAVWDAARAAELSGVLASAPDLLVIEDDHAAEVAGAPRCHRNRRALRAGPPSGRCLRSLGPDLRLAVVAGDAVTIARVEGRQALGTGWVSYLLQETVAELWQDPEVEALLGRAAATYADRREQLIGALAARGIPAAGRSGLAIWVPVADETGTASALLDRGWAVAPGERFRIASPPGIRIGIATLTATGDRPPGRGLVRLPAAAGRAGPIETAGNGAASAAAVESVADGAHGGVGVLVVELVADPGRDIDDLR